MVAKDPTDGATSQPFHQQTTITAQEAAERRAPIEHAVGMLMFVYGIDAEAAFDKLRHQSQNHNVKLRLVAEQIVKDLIELSRTTGPAHRLAVGSWPFAAHQLIINGAARKLGAAISEVPVVSR